jgi:protein subunit release factor A
VDIEPDDVRVDIIRVTGVGPCAVRATYLPTGTTVTVDDLASIEANRAEALARLAEAIPD